MHAHVPRIVRRVVQKVLSGASSSEPRAARGGVHVQIDTAGGPERPDVGVLPLGAAADPAPGGGLVTAEDLAGLPDGGALTLPVGARLTPLAEDEVWRRRIQLHRGSPSASLRCLRVALGADHGGYELKQRAIAWLRALGHEAVDLGTHDKNAVDYPDYAGAVAEAVGMRRVDLGICIDGAGIGSAMAANKVPGVRAAMCYDEATARNAREHNFANVLTLGAGMLSADACQRIVRTFLATPEGAARHERRVEKIMALEQRARHASGPVRRVLPEAGKE